MATYTHGHHESVLRSHRWRTVENSAAYLVPHMTSGMSVLDVGCGPGTITLDIAKLVGPHGRVLGIDSAPDAIAAAREAASRAGMDNVSFEIGDVFAIEAPEHTYDVVHAHQVLQHVSDPVTALQEMKRVRTVDGIVAARDSDYEAMSWFPESAELTDWLALYQHVARSNGGEPDAGRRLLTWAVAAGFEDVDPSASAWYFNSPADRAWWSEMWATRVTESALAEQAKEHGLMSADDLERLAAGWRRWGADDTAWFSVLHGEVLCRR